MGDNADGFQVGGGKVMFAESNVKVAAKCFDGVIAGEERRGFVGEDAEIHVDSAVALFIDQWRCAEELFENVFV